MSAYRKSLSIKAMWTESTQEHDACWDQGGFPASMQGFETNITPYKQQFSPNPGLGQNKAAFLSAGTGVTCVTGRDMGSQVSARREKQGSKREYMG